MENTVIFQLESNSPYQISLKKITDNLMPDQFGKEKKEREREREWRYILRIKYNNSSGIRTNPQTINTTTAGIRATPPHRFPKLKYHGIIFKLSWTVNSELGRYRIRLRIDDACFESARLFCCLCSIILLVSIVAYTVSLLLVRIMDIQFVKIRNWFTASITIVLDFFRP